MQKFVFASREMREHGLSSYTKVDRRLKFWPNILESSTLHVTLTE